MVGLQLWLVAVEYCADILGLINPTTAIPKFTTDFGIASYVI